MKELTEWAQREKLGARFQSGLEEVVKQCGLDASKSISGHSVATHAEKNTWGHQTQTDW